MKNLQERLQEGEESISKLKTISEEDVKIWNIQALGQKIKLKECLSESTPKVKEIESQLSKHKVGIRLLELAEY